MVRMVRAGDHGKAEQARNKAFSISPDLLDVQDVLFPGQAADRSRRLGALASNLHPSTRKPGPMARKRVRSMQAAE